MNDNSCFKKLGQNYHARGFSCVSRTLAYWFQSNSYVFFFILIVPVHSQLWWVRWHLEQHFSCHLFLAFWPTKSDWDLRHLLEVYLWHSECFCHRCFTTTFNCCIWHMASCLDWERRWRTHQPLPLWAIILSDIWELPAESLLVVLQFSLLFCHQY